MTGIPDPISGAIAHLVLDYVIEHKGRIERQINALKRKRKSGNLSILVLGAPGTGKSTLGRIFDAEPEQGTRVRNPQAAYHVSLGKEEGRVDGYWFTNVAILPGQKSKRSGDSQFNTAMTAIRNGKIHGIIHVVAAGLHSEYLGSVKFPYDFSKARQFVSTDETILERVRAELELLANVAEHLKSTDRSNKMWMITALNKQDIWFAKRGRVNRLYTEGRYSEIVEAIQLARGPENFQHEYVQLCLAMENFFDAEGLVKLRTATGYDTRMQIDSIFNFVIQLSKFCKIDVAIKGK